MRAPTALFTTSTACILTPPQVLRSPPSATNCGAGASPFLQRPRWHSTPPILPEYKSMLKSMSAIAEVVAWRPRQRCQHLRNATLASYPICSPGTCARGSAGTWTITVRCSSGVYDAGLPPGGSMLQDPGSLRGTHPYVAPCASCSILASDPLRS